MKKPARAPLTPTDLPVGILLAAGFGKRFDATGTRNKLLEVLPDGRTVAWRSARTLAAALPNSIAVVRPGNAALAEELRRGGCRVVEAPDAEAGMGVALRAGVAATAEARGWVVALADMPWLPMELVRAVALTITTPETIAAPWRDGKRGHPVGFGAAWRDALLKLDGDEGARALLTDQPVTRILTEDDGPFRDIDTPGDLAPRGK
ncbi:Nicotine blue oxidoreductase [Cupriavidus campinensis]|uniref:Nucleotidyltransferase family protein n=1 Tax=Cupriavidus campinensis TaxID=151783 RepID=A0AAE9L286_9BURK|nr:MULTISPECIES: nucleotidyltransferase family protein [Cupriavidus]TSP09421.1 nucleotidyltransferase family protein [Cupriavidus campinensis]URF04633.1 nucleotidyltransferase family protein [Cupriavidus campinensis]CAG2154500.1 Nicotine blue oxidoreductase [Cupriavidus campinensis]